MIPFVMSTAGLPEKNWIVDNWYLGEEALFSVWLSSDFGESFALKKVVKLNHR